MRKLIRLEIKKFKLFSYMKGVFIANFAILAFLCLIYFGEKIDGNVAFENYASAFDIFGSFIRATFIIFASVLIARLFIDEYRNNSISLMFMYPISRKKMMAAKLMIVAAFTFITIFLSNIFIGTVFYLADSYLHFVSKPLTGSVFTAGLINMTLKAVASAGMSLIPLYFGMRKKSIPAVIVTAILMVSLTSSTIDGVNMSSFLIVPIALAAAGCLIAYFSFRNIEKADIN